MISSEQIDEWIHEVEQRPTSAVLIIQFISRRLQDLAERNEALLAENIELRSGNKVEEYEKRIAIFEYQLDLLRRQLGSDAFNQVAKVETDKICLIAFTSNGHVTRKEIELDKLTSGQEIARFRENPDLKSLPRFLIADTREELVFAFDSGRTVTVSVSSIPDADRDALTWDQNAFVEPRGEEELVAVLPLARMSLFDYCLQTSRRGCLKKMMMASFESHILKEFIGSGVKQKPDQTFNLALANKDDHIVIASREGFLQSIPVSQAAYTAEEVLRLGTTDYLVSAFVRGQKPFLLVVTRNGKVINREMSWLEQGESGKSRGQPIMSATRREAGVRIAGAAAVEDTDWCIILCSDGQFFLYQASDLFASGAVGRIQEPVEVVDIAVFNAPAGSRKGE